MKAKQTLPSNAEITKFEMLNELISSIYIEMKEFSKKKPDDALNAFKVKNVNRVLTQLKDFLINQPTVSFLDLLDDEILPSNSDSILIIAQYKAAMDNFKKKYQNNYGRWKTNENPDGKTDIWDF